MNVTSQLRPALLAKKMKHWHDRALNPVASRTEIDAAHRNYWKLVRKYRAIARRYGFTEEAVLNDQGKVFGNT